MIIGIFLGTVRALSNNSWPLIWLGLELNLISFVPTIIKQETNKKPAIIYFIIQRIGSIILLSAGILTELKTSLVFFLLIGLVIKLGAAPLHFWLPRILVNLETLGLYLIIRWQKLAPIILIATIIIRKDILSYFNLWTGTILILAISRPIIVIIFSGVGQIGWLIAIHSKILIFFLFIYFIILMPIIKFLKTKSKNFLWGILNAGGLPPFSGFIIKLKAIISIKKKGAFIFIRASAVALSCYSRIILNSYYSSGKINKITYFSLLVGNLV